jgi:hypothetical protein
MYGISYHSTIHSIYPTYIYIYSKGYDWNGWFIYVYIEPRSDAGGLPVRLRIFGSWDHGEIGLHIFFYPQKPGPTLSIFLDLYIKLYWYIYIYMYTVYVCVNKIIQRHLHTLSLSIYIYTLRSYQTWQWEIPGQKWRFRAGKIIHEIFHV